MSIQDQLSHLKGGGELEKVEVWVKGGGGVSKYGVGSCACGRLHQERTRTHLKNSGGLFEVRLHFS